MKRHLPTETLESVEEKIKNIEYKRFTVADIASITGNNISDSKQIANELLEKYRGRLILTEANSLIYDFGKELTLRAEKTASEKWANFQKQAFQVLKKMVILGMQYTFIIHFFASPFFLFLWFGTAKRKIGQPKRKGFIQSLKDYAFGLESNQETEKFYQEKEIASFLRQNKGLLSISDIMRLSGKNREEAENFMTECLIRFDGEAKISDKNILYGDFDELRQSVNKTGDKVPIPIWEEPISELKFTGNSLRRNIFFTGVVGSSWLGNLMMLSIMMSEVLGFEILGFVLPMYGTSFVMSSLFLGLPAYRLLGWNAKKKTRRLLLIKTEILRVIFETSHRLTMEDIENQVINKFQITKNSEKKSLKKMIENIFHDLDAIPEASDAGNVYFNFPKIENELLEISRLRSNRERFKDDGDILMEIEN